MQTKQTADHKATLLGMLKRVHQPAEVCVGKGSLNRLRALSAERILVLSSASAESNGTIGKIREQLSASGLTLQFWTGQSQEPTSERITELGALARAFRPDWIVAVGGGSILDTAKFVWAGYEHSDLVFGAGVQAAIPPLRKKARFAAVPTTAGSGSEASQAAVLTDQSTGRKYPYVSPEWMPDIVILDPTVVVSLSPELTAYTGMDALTHAVEAYVSRLASPFVESLCAAAIRLILRWLPRAQSVPGDLEARENMLIAAYLGGLGQSAASTGLAHGLAHAAAAALRVPHALGTGFFLRLTMAYNASRSPGLYSRLGKEIGLPGEGDLLKTIWQLADGLGIPRSLAEITGSLPSEKDLEDIARLAIEDVCTRTNPVRAAESDLQQLLVKSC